MAYGSNFAVEFNWNTNISQNVQTFDCSKKVHGFAKKNEFTLKRLKVAILQWNATECGSFLKMFKKFCFLEKINRFSEKFELFLKWLNVSILLLNATETVRFSQNVENLFSLKKRWVSRENILNFFVKSIKVAKLPQNGMNEYDFSTNWILKIDGFFEKETWISENS